MIRVVIEMDESGTGLKIASDAPPPIVLAVVTSAYHEMLSQKIRADMRTEERARLIWPVDRGPAG